MAVCLSQLYHENKRGVKAGYAKFETFPIWNLPLKHPVNLAYEAATADLNDVNMIDPFHLEAYGVPTVNYNRDVEIFPVLNTIFEKIYGLSPYKSPTDMGVNMVGKCIIDNDAVCDASRQEIIRRYYQARCEEQKGKQCRKEIEKIEKLMSQAGFSPALREVATVANSLASETGNPAVALALPDGRLVTGKTKSLVGASAAALLNALKLLADIPDEIHLLSASVIEPVQDMKVKYLGNANPRLHLDEILVALSVCAASDENARRALECLPLLAGSEAHSSVILASTDSSVFRKLKVNLTCEPQFQTKKLYHS